MMPPAPDVITAAPLSVGSFLAALDHAEKALEQDARECCAYCDEAQATLDDAALVGKLRAALARASESEMASVLAWAEAA